MSTPVFLSHSGRSSGGPAITSNGDIYFVRDSYSSGGGLSRIHAGREERMSDWYYGGEVGIKSKDQFVIYSQYQPIEEFKTYLDVFFMGFAKCKEYRLTDSLRAQDPDFSPDFAWGDGRITRGALFT